MFLSKNAKNPLLNLSPTIEEQHQNTYFNKTRLFELGLFDEHCQDHNNNYKILRQQFH